MKHFFILATICLTACGTKEKTQQSTGATPPETTHIAKSVLIVIAPNDFRDEEFKEPFDLLTKSGMNVMVASTDTAPAKGMLGMVVQPQIPLNSVNPDGYDALIIVGGSGCKVLWDNDILHSIVRRFNETKKTIGAICIAPVVLARAEILKNIRATVFPDVKDEITRYDAEYTGAEVEVCGNIITGSGPDAAQDFARAILKNLNK